MSEDHLSAEISVSGELTEAGLKASAKSRTIASIDRLLGGVVDIGSAWLEGYATRRRAINDGERQLIEATAKYGLERLGQDKEFAERALENHFKKIGRAQLNKDAVAAEALLDLREQPPTEEEATAGPEFVSEEFMGRFERFAEGASTEQLRSRWGRVLAAEIREPGTFSPKVLRVTDELDAETAILFERICRYKDGGHAILKPLSGELGFLEEASLVSAGLLIEPGFTGQVGTFARETLDDGRSMSFFNVGRFTVGLDEEASFNFSEGVLNKNSKGLSVPVYVLTEAGQALSLILEYDDAEVFRELVLKLRSILVEGDIFLFERLSNGMLRELPDELFR